jgi:hypothetical protein
VISFSPGANAGYDADSELRRRMAIHPACNGGSGVARWLAPRVEASERLRDWNEF